jgi:molybdopterin biosynthesis enzyme
MKNESEILEAIPVQEAVGMVLGHDVTEIVPGTFKGRAFKKGHIIQDRDIEHLLRIGKEHIYVLNVDKGFVHEDEAAQRIAAVVAGHGLKLSASSEGRINMLAAWNGLLKVKTDQLEAVNAIDNVVVSSAHTNQQVDKGRAVAGTRVIPLIIDEKTLQDVEDVCSQGPAIEVLPFRKLAVGMVTTGSEVYAGRIQDGFGPVVRQKLVELDCSVTSQVFVSDDLHMTVQAVEDLIGDGADMIVLTGGMSVDPDDVTPSSIKAVADQVVSYGAPTFPGAMFMLAYKGRIPIIGLPGCVMYYKASIFDLIIPRLVAGDQVSKQDINTLGHGGFCAGCSPCRYPICPFGKG